MNNQAFLLPFCQEHNMQISHLDTKVGLPIGKRVLCGSCVLNTPTEIGKALTDKKLQIQAELIKYNEFFEQFLCPLQGKIKSLASTRIDFCKAISNIEDNLINEREKLLQEKQRILKSINLDFDCLTISMLQKIGEELSQQNFSTFDKDKINLNGQLEKIMKCKELTLLAEITTILDKLKQEFSRQELLKNVKDGVIKFQPFKKEEFKLDCYATAINNSEKFIVASHNIELILFEIDQFGVRKLDVIQDFGFFFEITFDKNDDNLLYLADYNSFLRIVRIENKKMKLLNTQIKFDSSVSCLVCSKNSEVIVSSQDLSFRSYKFINEVFTLLQEIHGVDNEISSINLNQDETLMATSHTNYLIKIWQKQDNLWVIKQSILTNNENTLQHQNKAKKDRNAVCFLKHNVLAYLSDTGILRCYKKDDADIYTIQKEFPYKPDSNIHFPSTYTLRFNYYTGLLVCHQYHKLQVFIQKDDGEIQEFQEFSDIRNQIVGCSLSETLLVAQDSQNFKLHILKLG